MPVNSMTHKFVETMPSYLEEGILYVSLRYATAVHKCACGCGTKVVTPISPATWQLIFDGDAVSLVPSVGNWALPCRSHYWIRGGRILWVAPWTEDEIDEGRVRDTQDIKLYFEQSQEHEEGIGATRDAIMPSEEGRHWWNRFWRWMTR